MNGNRIINVLSEPIYYSADSAGDWHDDDARDHVLSERENMVTFLPHQTNGYYDLQLKTKGKKWKQVFVWNNKEMRYQAANLKSLPKGKR